MRRADKPARFLHQNVKVTLSVSARLHLAATASVHTLWREHIRNFRLDLMQRRLKVLGI
jgi:hypothetical protein